MSTDTFEVRDRRSGFLRVDNDLYDRFGAQLGPYGLAVYMALCRYANRSDECWPAYATIARGTGISRRKVIYEIAKLERLGVIEIQRNRDKSNLFVLLDTTAVSAPEGVHDMHHGGAQHALPPVHDMHPSSARRAPKQSGRKKDPSTLNQDRRNYIPEVYRDIILG